MLWQCKVGEKHNEISALKPLITPSLVKGRILTLDAMPTQRELCAQVQQLGGAYILIAKDKPTTLAEDIATCLKIAPQTDGAGSKRRHGTKGMVTRASADDL